MSELPRRASHVEMPVAYAAVGATRDPDMMRFPPEGFTPYEEALKLGSGEERFMVASSLLMTWGAQRGAGVQVIDIERGADDAYEGVAFDAAGQAQAATGPSEEVFGPDGDPYLSTGTEATLVFEAQPRRVLVVYTVSEDRAVGFAWGTCDENGVVGEQLFTVEHREDGTVWAVARGFLAMPRNGLLGLKARADLRAVIEGLRRQLQALAPGSAAPNGSQTRADEDLADPES